MQSFLGNILAPLATAFFITVALTPIFIKYFKKIGLIDDPTRKHPAILHKVPIPRGGGIPLFLGVFVAAIIFLPITKSFIGIFIASLLSLVVGVLDDKYDISPYIRFGLNIIAGIIVISSGLNIPFITNPTGGILFLSHIFLPINLLGIHFILTFADAIALLWIVWVMNMLNWSKGVDGQMPGVVAISAIIIGILSLRFSNLDASSLLSAKLSFMIAGASLGFLIYNFYPARIFPGYGATSIYLLLAVVSILSSAKVATAILVMGVPLADGVFTIIRRVATGHSPFWHDKKHFHHLLLSAGFGQRRIALFYWIVSAIFGSLALILSSKGKLFAIILVVILVGGSLLFLNLFLRYKDDKNSI